MLQSVKISELPSADTLTEDDLIVIDQPDDTKKATLFQVLNHLEDSVEQSTLVVLAQPDGAKNIGGLGFSSPEMFGYLPGVTPDVVPYLQKAIDTRLPVNLGPYDYTVNTAPNTVTLPGDDGSAYPAWVAAGTDANIDAETANTIPAAIRIYSDTVIIGAGSNKTRIIGTWDADNPTINNEQPICFYIQANNPIDGYVRHKISGLTIKNFFIGRYSANILNHSVEDDLIVLDCCFPGIFLGADAVKNGFVTARGCWAAEVYGGWWTNRNAAITTPYLPPYPAEEIFKVGWIDSLMYEKFAYYGRQRTFGATDIAIDTWFDTYIYKSANSAATAAGGRRTNNTASGFAVRAMKGVANRAFMVLSRYGRQVNSVIINEFKSLCTSRVPIYTDAGNKNSVLQAYVERSGLVNTTTSTTSSNEFYLNYTDPYDTAYSIPPAMVCQGSIVVDRVVVSAGVATNPFSESVNELSGPRRLRTFRRDESDYNLFEISEWNSGTNKVNYWYSWDRSSSVQRPIYFYNRSQEKFEYYSGSWTPALKCGSDSVTLTTAAGTFRKIGNVIYVTFRIETNSMALTSGGAVVISGLPFTVAALSNGGFSLVPVVCSRAANPTTSILAQTKPSSKELGLVTGSTLNAFNITSGTDLTIYGSIQYITSE